MLMLNEDIKCIKRDKIYYLEDTKRSQLYRIGEPEHEVFSLLLQNLPIEEIGERLKGKSKIQNEEIQKFKTRLVELEILTQTQKGKQKVKLPTATYYALRASKVMSRGASKRNPPKPLPFLHVARQGAYWRRRTNIFHLRFPLFNPSRVLEWFVRLKISKYIFSLPSLLIVLAIIGAGMVIFLRNKDVLLSFNLLFQTPQYIPVFLFVFLLSTLLHEMTHGLVCTYYGGKVKELGIGLFYFIPTFYVSLKGIWLFKKKRNF